ncbi:hypothetical protein KGZ01_18230 [Pseudomonas aeruginosa]|uniref:hypothetical protein n=1 Tax=Pseudomonas aeruginosa TaxID=287 RepID=UPI002341A6B7|nr:hypothetical protein [Pseudomonas aeruginosa]MDC3993168.1 hypothetical protein [Pseudomonas aeruginosa]
MAASDNIAPALNDMGSVKEFSSTLLELVGNFQSTLHRLSETDKSFANSGYAVLMEVYGLRTRGYILLNDSGNHVVNSLGFSQGELLNLFERIKVVAQDASTLKMANAIVLSVATFTVALGEDRNKVVDFLFDTLCNDVSDWEGLVR